MLRVFKLFVIPIAKRFSKDLGLGLIQAVVIRAMVIKTFLKNFMQTLRIIFHKYLRLVVQLLRSIQRILPRSIIKIF